MTTAQPTTNPRVVKEADALSAAGHHVQVVGAFAGQFAMQADPALLAGRSWTVDLVDWRRESDRRLYWTSRVRHRAASRISSWRRAPMAVVNVAASRPTPELTSRALSHVADLYIAHTLGALPAVAAAARRYGSAWGFDAEDFHSGQFPQSSTDPMRRVAERVERHYLPGCAYLTAASPGIADAYRPFMRHRQPRCVLNVSPLSDRTAAAGPTDRDEPNRAVRLYWFSQTIGPDRGLEDVVQAMGRLPIGSLALHLRGVWASGYEARLRQLANACHVSQSCIVGHPPDPADAMVSRAADHDVGLALEPGATPNSRLAISNKLLTYLMAGIPVLASRTLGQQWVLDRAPGCGWSYEPGDVSHLVALLSGPVLSHSARAAARRASLRAADTRFCWEVEQRGLLDEVGAVLVSHAVSQRRVQPAGPVALGERA